MVLPEATVLEEEALALLEFEAAGAEAPHAVTAKSAIVAVSAAKEVRVARAVRADAGLVDAELGDAELGDAVRARLRESRRVEVMRGSERIE